MTEFDVEDIHICVTATEQCEFWKLAVVIVPVPERAVSRSV